MQGQTLEVGSKKYLKVTVDDWNKVLFTVLKLIAVTKWLQNEKKMGEKKIVNRSIMNNGLRLLECGSRMTTETQALPSTTVTWKITGHTR